ncbi:hypothetical protein OESDEN_08005 [Oesophagostomum dentatum]|uniref:Peptidase S1 domain-containing protein n=1 Tax=Oesophagostomum dentatum TaxID=61180 RepID=A0A0B1T8K4_OESDE|nr:hypothetical protein OESDEN_08005 [Oesophagostomum dentatum]
MPDYDTSTRDSTRFDLAIIELLRDVDENEAIPICMPPADLPLPKKLIAIGYGDDPHAENPREPGLQVTTFSKFKEREFEIDAIGQDRGTCGKGSISTVMFGNTSTGYALRQVRVASYYSSYMMCSSFEKAQDDLEQTDEQYYIAA